MFTFIKNILLKKRAKKILSYVEKRETELTLFQTIDNNEDKHTKFIRSLSKQELYADVVSRYNVCIRKIGEHNEEIQTLTFAYNTILQAYPIADILDNILECSKYKIEEIYSTIKQVYTYVIPNSFPHKEKYDTYKKGIE